MYMGVYRPGTFTKISAFQYNGGDKDVILRNTTKTDPGIIKDKTEPLHEKTDNLGFRSGLTQTGLCSLE